MKNPFQFQMETPFQFQFYKSISISVSNEKSISVSNGIFISVWVLQIHFKNCLFHWLSDLAHLSLLQMICPWQVLHFSWHSNWLTICQPIWSSSSWTWLIFLIVILASRFMKHYNNENDTDDIMTMTICKWRWQWWWWRRWWMVKVKFAIKRSMQLVHSLPSNVAILQKIKCKGKTLQRYPPKDKVLQYMWREADVSKVKGKVR